jgi:hypothetical protein
LIEATRCLTMRCPDPYMNTTKNIWRTEDGTHFFGPFTRTGEFDITRAIALVGKTWSPTRSAAGYTASVNGFAIGRNYPTVAAAKLAIGRKLHHA